MRRRSPGFDVARAVAILGMFVVHAGLVLGPSDAGGISGSILALGDGRAAATFLVLAGIATARLGAALGTAARSTLRRRGVLLLGLGFLNLVVWPGDILRIYGVALLLAPWLLGRSSRHIVAISILLFVGFVPLLLFADWESAWRSADLDYKGLWTARGIVRNLAFDGFRSLIPWLGFYTLGVALGRLSDLRIARLAVPGAVFALAAAAVSWHVVATLSAGATTDEGEVIVAVFGTASMPPMPLFLATAIGGALAVIGGSIRVASAMSRVVAPLEATGRMAGTWYLAHIAALVALAIAGVRMSAPVALVVAVIAFALCVALSWVARGRRGLFERLLRAVDRAPEP